MIKSSKIFVRLSYYKIIIEPFEVSFKYGKEWLCFFMYLVVNILQHKYKRIDTIKKKEFYKTKCQFYNLQGGSNMIGTNCDLFTHK
jgi:hypothetical protein